MHHEPFINDATNTTITVNKAVATQKLSWIVGKNKKQIYCEQESFEEKTEGLSRTRIGMSPVYLA